MRCTSYLPVCYTTKDLTVSDNGRTWLLNNNVKIGKSGHGYDGLFPPCHVNQYQGYDKEVLRQTILQQEAAFKDQVNELHRLYKRQRELMDDIKMRELSRHNPEAKTSQSNPFLSKKLSESAQKTCQIPSLPLVNQACYWPSVLYTKKFQAPSSSVTGKSMQSGPNTSHNGSSHKDIKLLSSNIRKFGKRTLDLELLADKYIDSKGGARFEEGNFFEVSEVPVHLPRELSDICHQSESKFSLCYDKLNSSQEDPFGSRSISGKTYDLTDSNKTIQLEKPETLYSTSHLGPGTCHMEKPNWKQEPLQKSNTTFQVLHKEIACCIQVRKDLEACSASMHLQKVERQPELLYNIDEAGRNRSSLLSPHLKLVSPYVPVSTQLVPRSSLAKLDSSVPFEEKLIHTSRSIPMAIQALPCFDIHVSSTCAPLFPSVGSLQNNLLPGFRLESLTLKTSPTSTILEPLNCYNDNGYTNKERESSTPMDSGSQKEFIASRSDVDPQRHGNFDSSNYEMSHGSIDNSYIVNDQLSAVAPKLHPNLSEDKVTENNEKIEVLGSELAHCPTLSTGKWSIVGELVENGVDCKCQIDLNSSPDEDESAQVVMNSAADINLEPPVSPENKESSPPRGKSEEKQLETSIQLSEQEDGFPTEDISMIAAEVLVSISSAGFQLYLDDDTSKPFETSCNCLHWFSAVVSSMADVIEDETETALIGTADSNHNELLADGINYFEGTTLQLKETKAEEYSCKSTGQKKKRISATSLPSRPKRRRTRTKSQKDFQGEALPRLASHSRHEVTENLHVIGGSREAARTCLETGLGWKNDNRNGRRRGKPSIVVESPMCSLLKPQSNDTEVGFLEGCLTGWGKTNKRPRGQRFPARNPCLIYSRVN